MTKTNGTFTKMALPVEKQQLDNWFTFQDRMLR